MKKGLLLLAAAAVAVSASAQNKNQVATSKVADSGVAPFECTVVKAEMATDAQRAAMKKVAPKAAVKAWYNRPAGTFYRSLTAAGGAFYNPVLVLPCWRDVTFTNASTGADAYSWKYDKYDTSIKDWATMTSTNVDLTDNFLKCSMLAPTLTATGGGATSTYQLFSTYINQKTRETKDYEGLTYYYDDPRAEFQSGENAVDCYLSPKYFCAGTREQPDMLKGRGGVITLTGAADADGGKDGYWFGQNASGWNGMAVYVEKPASPYALRGIHVLYMYDQITGATPLEAKVYAVEKDDKDNLIFGDLIATAKGTLAADAEDCGFIDLPLVEEEEGLQYEVVANIDRPIAVVFSGYEKANTKGFRMVISTDCVNEGYGQHGYMCKIDAEGYPTQCVGLDQFFTSSLGYTAPSIFLDVEWPIMIWNYTFEDGKYNFPKTGGAWQRTVGTTKFDAISVYSTKSSEEWTVTTVDGQDVPEWLTLQVADVQEAGEFTGEVQIKATAAALPADVEGREAKVKFAVPGAELVYDFTQGTVSGINDVTTTIGGVKAHKVVENGQVLVVVGDKKYNMMGAEVK